MTIAHALTTLSDAALLAEVKRLVAQERTATARLIESLMELDARRLYLAEGCSSLFTYCTSVLHLSEHAAFGRIEVARAARRLPALLDRLLDGSVTVTNARMLAAHLTVENHVAILEAARHKSKRDIERMVADLRPKPDVPSLVRRLPVSRTIQEDARPPVAAAVVATTLGPADPEVCAELTDHVGLTKPAPKVLRSTVVPLAPERYRVQLSVSQAAHDHLRRAQDLLRHLIPTGDPAAIVERALAVLVEQLERAKCAATPAPRRSTQSSATRSRHIPAAVRREVWRRDEGRCAFVGARGRCAERGFLEFHHVTPFAAGGPSDATNIQLRCRAHNRFEAELFFGADAVRERAPAWDDSVRTEPSLSRFCDPPVTERQQQRGRPDRRYAPWALQTRNPSAHSWSSSGSTRDRSTAQSRAACAGSNVMPGISTYSAMMRCFSGSRVAVPIHERSAESLVMITFVPSLP